MIIEIIITKVSIFLNIILKSIACKIIVDKIIAGKVNKSPKAAIIGLVILSGSHPFLKLLNDTNIVIGSITKFEMIPAITHINIKSIKSIDGWLRIIHKNFAIIAKNKDKTIVKTKAAKIL